MEFSTLQYLHGRPTATGVVKAFAEDFFVAEELGFTPDGEGEHVLVRLRKEGCNTQFVAENLARFARIAARSVSYAGLKDRHAVTEQWFCLHLPGRDLPDFSQLVLEGCQVLAVTRHRKKLRIGTLRGNAFRLVLRHISDSAEVEERLRRVAAQGVPNYVGEQRFGRGGNNLQQARRWAADQIRVKERAKRSFYLSAARSALFNQLVSERLKAGCFSRVLAGDALQLAGRGSWFVAEDEEMSVLQQRLDAGELRITAALPGEGDGGVGGEALAFERRVLSEYVDLQALLTRERVASARRAVLLQPQAMAWNWWDDATVELTFDLPAGSFATSVVRELFCQENPNADLTE